MAGEKTATGLPRNTEAAANYIPFIGWLPAIYFLIAEKDSFVRYHAIQSIILWVIYVALTLSSIIIFILLPLSPLFFIGLIAIQLYTAIQAYNGKEFKLPVIGEFAKKQLGKIK